MKQHLLSLTITLFTIPCIAQEIIQSDHQEITIWHSIQSGGIVGYIIILISIVATALVLEHFFSIKRERLLPDDLQDDISALLQANKINEAQILAGESDTLLGKILAAGLKRIGSAFGFFDMQSAMQETSEREIGKLYRKLEILSFIAAATPMLGLLGTVIGMIGSFNQLVATEGAAKPSQLAGGISEALVTTCLGLIVAIPAMFFVSYFRNRIDSYIAEAETIVEQLLGRFRNPGNR